MFLAPFTPEPGIQLGSFWYPQSLPVLISLARDQTYHTTHCVDIVWGLYQCSLLPRRRVGVGGWGVVS